MSKIKCVICKKKKERKKRKSDILKVYLQSHGGQCITQEEQAVELDLERTKTGVR